MSVTLIVDKLYWDRYECKVVKWFTRGCHIKGATFSSLCYPAPRLRSSRPETLKASESTVCFNNGPLWWELPMKLFAFKAASHCEMTRFQSGQAYTLNFRTCTFSVDELLQNIRESYAPPRSWDCDAVSNSSHRR